MKIQKFIITKRDFLKIIATSYLFYYLPSAMAGNQKEADLSISIATLMKNSINDVNRPFLIYPNKYKALQWLKMMDVRLSKFIDNYKERYKILFNVNYESSRAGLNPQLILGLIEVESRFNRYAISSQGALGLMQVMPFWVKSIGNFNHNLFDIKTNLRYGCTILKFYIELEKGDLFRALGRYNGSLGQSKYPKLVFNAYLRNWYYE